MALQKNVMEDVNSDDPWVDDVLERKPVAERLTNIVSTITQPFVVSLGSPYGTGKSFFLKRWRKHLENEGYIALYFNAWETDFSDDPLVAFVSELRTQFKARGLRKNNRNLKGMMKATAAYSRKVLPRMIKMASAGALDADIIKESFDFSTATDRQLTDLLGGLAADALARHEQGVQAITDFRTYLAGIREQIVKNDDLQKKQIVVLVDELDRCRPTYAIELLECIKHLFAVENYVFVLGVDESQIVGSIKSIYGADLDAEGYVRKFFDWRLWLEKPLPAQYANYLCKKFRLEEVLPEDPKSIGAASEFVATFGVFAEVFGLSLRAQDQCFTELSLALRSLPVADRQYSQVLAALAVLRTVDRSLYALFCQRRAPLTTVQALIAGKEKALTYSLLPDQKCRLEWPLALADVTDAEGSDRLRVHCQNEARIFKNANRPTRSINLSAEMLDKYKVYLANLPNIIKSMDGDGKIPLCVYLYDYIERGAKLTDSTTN